MHQYIGVPPGADEIAPLRNMLLDHSQRLARLEALARRSLLQEENELAEEAERNAGG